MDKKQGKLVCFEGIDGSGKTTQIDLLSKSLTAKGQLPEVISFPQYGKNQHADKIYDYLSGKFGRIKDTDPNRLAKFYADDRKTVREQILNWLKSGKIVLVNRYISSSKAHLGANLTQGKREEFIAWVDNLEYQTNNMPKPDLTILLNIDPKKGQQNALKDHLRDIHEQDLTHEEKAAKIYLELSQAEENWQQVECMKDGDLKSKKEIHKLIVEILDSIL